METVRKALSTLGGILLAALVLAAFAPKAVHGVVATLVQVANTSANPVPVLDGAAQQPYQTQCNNHDAFNSCILTVPTGKRFVIQSFNMTVGLSSGVQIVAAQLQISRTDPITHQLSFVSIGLNPQAGAFDGSVSIASATQPVTAFADAGIDNLFCIAFLTSPEPSNCVQCNLFGYLVSQT